MVAQAKLKSRCKIKESLGQGGMGVVHRAYDTVIRRDFAPETIRDTRWRKCKSAQWVVNYLEKNYCLFEIDSRSLSRTVDRSGKKGLAIKVPHPLEKQTTYTLQASVAGNTVTRKIFDGKSWVMLDKLKFPGADSTVGKFGMFVPGKDQVGLSHITFKPI